VPERPRARSAYPPRPAQLPPAISGFAGRAGALAELEAALGDGRMARAAGAKAVGVAWGYHEVDELEAAGAHAIAATFRDVPDAVHRLVP
ncbi:MAG TPA: hypothetical protein VI113_09450, partial [Alphaproteobacteria bacterium]